MIAQTISTATPAADVVTVSRPDRYAEGVTRRLVPPKGGKGAYFGMTKTEWDVALANMRPPTADDCIITGDGRRIDTREKLLEHLAEENAKRAQAAATAADVDGQR
jgi:2-C-methyl-D-erythritol 4-phosphate cytidylyltransferase